MGAAEWQTKHFTSSHCRVNSLGLTLFVDWRLLYICRQDYVTDAAPMPRVATRIHQRSPAETAQLGVAITREERVGETLGSIQSAIKVENVLPS